MWYLFLAYGVIWLGLALYVVRLAQIGREVLAQIDALREQFESGEAPAPVEYLDREAMPIEQSVVRPAGQAREL